MFCILVISENNNNPGLFCTLPALISRFFKWTEIKFILSRDTQKHLTFYSKFIPVLLQNTVKKWEKYRYYSWPRMLGDWKWRPKMRSRLFQIPWSRSVPVLSLISHGQHSGLRRKHRLLLYQMSIFVFSQGKFVFSIFTLITNCTRHFSQYHVCCAY